MGSVNPEAISGNNHKTPPIIITMIIPSSFYPQQMVWRLEAVRDAGNVAAVAGAKADCLKLVGEVANLDAGLARGIGEAAVLRGYSASASRRASRASYGCSDAVRNVVAVGVILAGGASRATWHKRLPVAIPVAYLHRRLASSTSVGSRSSTVASGDALSRRGKSRSGQSEDGGDGELHNVRGTLGVF